MTFPVFTWPDWKKAKSGTRFEHIQTGATGTLIGPAKTVHNGAIVVWDDRPFPVRSVDGEEGHVYFVGIARDARPLTFKAWDLIGFDGTMPYYPERSQFGHGRVQIKGGRALYESVTFYDDSPGEKVKLSRLDLGSDGIRQVDRWVDPDTELLFVADLS